MNAKPLLQALIDTLRELEQQLERNEVSVEENGNPEFDEWLKEAVLEGALLPDSEEELAALEALLEDVEVPNAVLARLQKRWVQDLERRALPRGAAAWSPRESLAFRRSPDTSADHDKAEKAIERFRRKLRKEEKPEDE